MNAHNILIVEDDEMAQMAISRLLVATAMNVQCEFSSNGREALELLESKLLGDGSLPSAIVMDLMMPEMTGFEFLEALEQLQSKYAALKDVPVFVVSSADSHEDVSRCKRYDCVKAYVCKYPNSGTLANLLQRHCQPLSSGA